MWYLRTRDLTHSLMDISVSNHGQKSLRWRKATLCGNLSISQEWLTTQLLWLAQKQSSLVDGIPMHYILDLNLLFLRQKMKNHGICWPVNIFLIKLIFLLKISNKQSLWVLTYHTFTVLKLYGPILVFIWIISLPKPSTQLIVTMQVTFADGTTAAMT